MSGSLCWLSFNSYYFSAWPIHHLECFLIYGRDNVDSSGIEDIHCGLEMKTPGCRFSDRNIIFLSSEVSNLSLCFDLRMGRVEGCSTKLGTTGLQHLSSSSTAGASCIVAARILSLLLLILLMLMSAASSGVGKCFSFCLLTFSIWTHPRVCECMLFGISIGSELLCAELLLVGRDPNGSGLACDCSERSVSTFGLERQGRSNSASFRPCGREVLVKAC